jgi:hypothetical protein
VGDTHKVMTTLTLVVLVLVLPELTEWLPSTWCCGDSLQPHRYVKIWSTLSFSVFSSEDAYGFLSIERVKVKLS